MNIFKSVTGAVSGLVSAVFSGIDAIDTSEEERLTAKAVILKAEGDFRVKMAGYAVQLEEIKASVITAEIASNSWLAKSWRPMLMLTFGAVIVYATIAPSFGAPPVDMTGVPDRMWSLMSLGVGGYVGGRTLEKIAPQIAQAISTRSKDQDEE